MDEDRIGLVLAKTSELRTKIINCIHKTSNGENEESPDAENQENDVEEHEESLLNIKDALESLEAQLSSLQALQQQQWYDKEAALAEIEYSQKKLLKELKEYKGKDVNIINEAIAFASREKDDTNNDLLLPPYPTRPSSQSLSFPSTRKFSQNGLKNEIPNNFQELESDRKKTGPTSPFNRLKGFIGAAAKTGLTIVGVIAILSLAGFEPRMRKRDNRFNSNDEKGNKNKLVECPSGKVPVIENGETRCIVKERVEIPFGSFVGAPDVSYGCG